MLYVLGFGLAGAIVTNALASTEELRCANHRHCDLVKDEQFGAASIVCNH
jgi:hypothetical protein